MKKSRDINAVVENWQPPKMPDAIVLEGNWARLEPFSAEIHGPDIHEHNSASDRIWEFLPYGPFANLAEYSVWAGDIENRPDPYFLAISDRATGAWCGVASYLRIAPAAGSIEVGHINFAPALQRTRAATEAMYLMMRWAFEAGYRRYEWKCNASNLGSRRAAQRLGLSFEGVFRQAAVIKGRNRDTAWFAAIDQEWPQLKEAFESWLDQRNFDGRGNQIKRLGDLTAPILAARDPVFD